MEYDTVKHYATLFSNDLQDHHSMTVDEWSATSQCFTMHRAMKSSRPIKSVPSRHAAILYNEKLRMSLKRLAVSMTHELLFVK